MRKTLLPFLLLLLTTPFFTSHGQMRITEFMYDGPGKEFVEFTNVGTTTINMTGWSYDDDSRISGTVSLSAFGIVKPGESVILAENTITAFRSNWNLCDNVKVIGNLTTNLGRADEINLFDASGTLVDNIAYGDQVYAGTIRTQNKSGWVTAAGLGNNLIAEWQLSAVADLEGSYTSVAGETGSPGKSIRAAVAYNPCPPGIMRITEFMYDGANAEFVEFTNTGTTPVDMTGYSYDDDSRLSGTVSLSAFGIVQPGESVILAESSTTTFRSAWQLCNGIKIIGGLSTNLGRADEINLFNAAGVMVDRLTYGDQAIPGTIRTQNKSGWVNETGLGTNQISQWTLSTVADAEGSVTSSGGDIGSPGKSTCALINYNACPVIVGAPTIVIDVASTSNTLDAGATTSPVTPYAVSGVINDAADPARTMGIHFTIGDDVTPVANLTVTVGSSNTTVVPNANLVLTGTNAARHLTITPASVGYTNITVTVNDGTYTSSYILHYAASMAATAGTQWLTGIADASAAIELDNDYMVIANDETNLLYVYHRNESGLPVKTFDFNNNNVLGLTDGSTNNWKEVDVESVVKSTTVTGRTYWLGSMSNSSSFNDKPNRNRILAIDITGTGATTTFSNAGHYTGLRSQLITWGDSHGYNFTASAADGKDSKTIDGFNAEGMVFGPDNTTLYIGFRAPYVPIANRTKAVIAPIQQFETWFNNGAPSGNAVIGNPIELDLGNRGIRDIVRLSNGTYVIVAGSFDETAMPAIFRWTGNPADAPQLIPSLDLTGMNAEAAMPVNNGNQLSLEKIQIISDNGDNIFYNDGIAAKDLPQDNYKKFMSRVIVSAVGGVLPVHFDYFMVQRRDAGVLLTWATGLQDDPGLFEIMRSNNGIDFVKIHTITAVAGQTNYQFVDGSASTEKQYYRVIARDLAGQSYATPVRMINAIGTQAPLITLYPNPTSTGRTTLLVSQTGNKTLQVYNSAGLLYKQTNFTSTALDLVSDTWPKGWYILRVGLPDGTIISDRLIVQ